MTFKRVLTLAAVASMITCQAHAGETITLTDVSGREVTVEVPVKHMILGEGRFCQVLASLILKIRSAG